MVPNNVPAATTAVKSPDVKVVPTVPRPGSLKKTLTLPINIYSHADVSRVSREAENLETFFTAAGI